MYRMRKVLYKSMVNLSINNIQYTSDVVLIMSNNLEKKISKEKISKKEISKVKKSKEKISKEKNLETKISKKIISKKKI